MLQPQKKEDEPAKIGHQRTPTAEDFPLPAKQLLATSAANPKDAAAVTPAKSSFTFSDIEGLMPGQAKSRQGSRPPSRPGSSHQSPGPRINGQANFPELPAKPSIEGLRRQETGGRKLSAASTTDAAQRPEIGRARSTMSILPFREVSHGARERVHRDSVILAEVKTNIIVREMTSLRPRAQTDRPHRSETSSCSSKNSLPTFLRDTKSHCPPSSSPSTIQRAFYLPIHSTLHTSSPSPLSPRKSLPRQTNAMQLSSNPS